MAYVTVTPAMPLRVPFAQHVVSADPYTRTVGLNEFAVRTDVFTHMPEELLVGSTIDGTPYRAVVDEELPAETDPLADEQHSTISGLHVCEVCDKTSTTAAGLAAHRRAKHKES
jgi:hypothetical protein